MKSAFPHPFSIQSSKTSVTLGFIIVGGNWFFFFFRGQILQSVGLKFSNNKYSFVIFLSLKKKKSTISWGDEFSEKISIYYISSLYQGVLFFLWILWYNHIGNHPQEGLIFSMTSDRNSYMGIFWNSSYGRPGTIPKTISEITILFSSSTISFSNNDFILIFKITISYLFISISLTLSPYPPT